MVINNLRRTVTTVIKDNVTYRLWVGEVTMTVNSLRKNVEDKFNVNFFIKEHDINKINEIEQCISEPIVNIFIFGEMFIMK